MFQGDTPLQDQFQPQVQESQPFVKRHVSIIASIRIVYIGFISITNSGIRAHVSNLGRARSRLNKRIINRSREERQRLNRLRKKVGGAQSELGNRIPFLCKLMIEKKKRQEGINLQIRLLVRSYSSQN
ncbi:hypothetical protein Hdeb2414_s0026g00678121 [Helianthus debilis subsp. tardiflorus]